jgi:putative redox protein
MPRPVRVHTDTTAPAARFRQTVEVAEHRLIADEPKENGGDDAGPSPHELLLAALGACSSMTVKLYADRKGWPLTSVDVQVTMAKEKREQGEVTALQRTVRLEGELTGEQRDKLLEIAGKCPVHKTLSGPIEIASRLA